MSLASHWGGHHPRSPEDFSGKLNVVRVRLNSGGYNSSGRYFGVGAPLYNVNGHHDGEDVEFYIRAKDRNEAKQIVQAGYPLAGGLISSRKRRSARNRYAKHAKKW
jgi:hypothetical protein